MGSERREHNRNRTKCAIADAALRSVAEVGYEKTTIEAIAKGANVSVRTFHNYFASKSEVLAHHLVSVFDQLEAGLVSQPENENVWCSLRKASCELADREAADGNLQKLSVALDSHSQIRNTAAEAITAPYDRIKVEIARRTNCNAAADIIPMLALELALAAGRTAMDVWMNRAANTATLSDLVNESFNYISTISAPNTTTTA